MKFVHEWEYTVPICRLKQITYNLRDKKIVNQDRVQIQLVKIGALDISTRLMPLAN
jgi:hypothetical protein